MSTDRIYLDCNATMPMRPAVRLRMIELLDRPGNASSIHEEGRAARAAIEQAREEVAALVGVPAEGVTFTSGATEAVGLALAPGLSDGKEPGPAATLLLGATEHRAVLNGHRFPTAACQSVPVDGEGMIDLPALQRRLEAAPGRAVLALQAANGETGVVQPVAQAAALLHARGGLLVCDAVQSAGRLDSRADVLGADVLILSAHKLGGPQGVGAVVTRGAVRLGSPLIQGGGQERGRRGGTENVAAIAGFGVAARAVADLADVPRLTTLRDRLEAGVRAACPAAVVFGKDAPRLGNTSAFAIPHVAGDTLLIALDLAGIAVSTGSACASGKVSRSHVLEAMGSDAHLRDGLIRVSLGWGSTEAHVERFVAVLTDVLGRIARRGMRAAA